MTQGLHVVGSPSLGGTELLFARLVNGLCKQGTDVAVVTRLRSGIAEQIDPGLRHLHLPMRNKLDYYSRRRIGIPDDALVVMAAGRMVERKALHWLN